jgi:transcriptional regulator with XRE-family HTH domain
MTIDVEQGQTANLSDRVAEEIRALLGRRRMTQAELARRLGTSGAWLNYRLTGKQPIDVNDLAEIAATLGVPVTDLIPADGFATGLHRKARTTANGLARVIDRPMSVRPQSAESRPPNMPGARRPAMRHRSERIAS